VVESEDLVGPEDVLDVLPETEVEMLEVEFGYITDENEDGGRLPPDGAVLKLLEEICPLTDVVTV